MKEAIRLSKREVPSTLVGGYNGRLFKVYVVTEINVPSDAGLWSGGSRETYTFVELSTGRTVNSPAQDRAPWDWARQSLSTPLPVGIVMRKHSYFCGKDRGLTFYVHPDNAAKLLPQGCL